MAARQRKTLVLCHACHMNGPIMPELVARSNVCEHGPLESRVRRKPPARFGGGSVEKESGNAPDYLAAGLPSEHRLFSFISGNWAGTPLRTWELLLATIRGTTTNAGLTVEATLHPVPYATGWSVTDRLMRTLNFERHAICPAWNYTLRPRPGAASAT
jgi:hypothetical protein